MYIFWMIHTITWNLIDQQLTRFNMFFFGDNILYSRAAQHLS